MNVPRPVSLNVEEKWSIMFNSCSKYDFCFCFLVDF